MAESVTAVVANSIENTKPLQKTARPWLRRGNPGNKGGGRKPEELKAQLRAIAQSPDALKAVKAIAENSEHAQCVRANAALWDVVIPKEQRHIVEGAPPPLVVVFRHE